MSDFIQALTGNDSNRMLVTATQISTSKRALDVTDSETAQNTANATGQLLAVNDELNTHTTKLTSIDNKQDYANFESTHMTLVAGADTTITFSQTVRLVRITNWDIVNRLLVKNGVITSNTDSSASRVGIAPALNVPNSEVFPILTASIHIRSASASEITVEGFV